jgi:hypothetical protein
MKISLKRGKLLAAVCAIVVSTTVAAGTVSRHAQMPEDGWLAYKNDEFGYSLYYPSTFFEPQAIAAAGRTEDVPVPGQEGQAGRVGRGQSGGHLACPLSLDAAERVRRL